MKGVKACLALSTLLLSLGARGGPSSPREEELVVPVKVDSVGRQRATGEQFYRLDAFGERFGLELKPDDSFLAPALTFQYVGSRPQGRREEEEAHQALGANLASCFYSGTVNGDPASAAALSLCGGIRGAFYLRGSEYLIQPANVSQAPGGEQPQLHLLSRSRQSPVPRGSGTKCEVPDSSETSASKGRRHRGEKQQADYATRAGITILPAPHLFVAPIRARSLALRSSSDDAAGHACAPDAQFSMRSEWSKNHVSTCCYWSL